MSRSQYLPLRRVRSVADLIVNLDGDTVVKLRGILLTPRWRTD